jgi:uncharacterized repeat protein (TIGR01451 family)/LPXTG-motif cell wall-anchored protein
VWAADSAGAQSAEVDLGKSVALNPAQVGPGQRFTYFLSYSCSSLTAFCTGARIVDVLPPQLSRAATDVEFGGNFASSSYDPATGTATFVLFDPLPPGTTAQVSIAVEFPPGTAPGTQAVNQASMSATNAPTVQSNPVTVTATAAAQYTVSKGLAPGQAAAQLDTPTTYRVGITVAAGGTQVVNNARFVDTLPPGVQFVSASQGGVYDAATNTVTWQLGTLTPQANNDVTITREVTVIYPSTAFTAGDRPNNVVEAFGTPSGGTDTLLGQDDFAVTLRNPGDITSAGKRDTLASLGPGQFDTYTVTGSNPTVNPLQGFLITDNLPPELSMVQDGSPNITGTSNPPVTLSWRAAGGTFQTVPVNGGGAWSATVPANADEIQASYGDVPVNFSASFSVRAGIPLNNIDRNGALIPANAPIRNCVVVAATGAIPRTSCTEQTVVAVSVQFSKVITSAPVTAPGGIVNWSVGVGVDATSAGTLDSPVVTDCLPAGLDLVEPTNPADPANGTATGFSVAPTISRTAGGCGSGQVLITWTWPAGFVLQRGQSGTLSLNTRVSLEAAPGLVVNTAVLNATSLSAALQRTANLAITSATLLVGFKQVQGDVDTTFVGFGTIGRTTRGGGATYQAVISNVSDVPVTNLLVVDTLPTPGDIGVVFPEDRGSAWRPAFAGGFTSVAPASVSYSTSTNPCRPELTVNAPGCQPANWSATPSTSTGAIRVDFGSFVLPPGGSVRFNYNVDTPTNAPVGQIAWNSFGYTATRADNGEALVPTEPRKVGLEVIGQPTPPTPGIDLVKFVNGIHAPNPPGPTIPAGNDVVFTYRVTNTSALTLIDISLVDDEIGVVTCPRTQLAPGESMLCTSATEIAISGQYDNVATVTGYPVDTDGQPAGPPLTDTDRGHYTNGELPETGSDTSTVVQLGSLLLVLGVALTLLTRRRSRPERA